MRFAILDIEENRDVCLNFIKKMDNYDRRLCVQDMLEKRGGLSPKTFRKLLNQRLGKEEKK